MRGFTLIELVITMVIIAILTAIAYPLYLHQVVEGRRSSAEAVLMDIAQREQQYFLDQRQYAAGTDYAAVSSNLSVTIPQNVYQYYSVSVTTGTAPPSFTATVTPKAGTPQAGDYTLTINQATDKETYDSTGAKVTPSVW